MADTQRNSSRCEEWGSCGIHARGSETGEGAIYRVYSRTEFGFPDNVYNEAKSQLDDVGIVAREMDENL